MDEFLLIVTSLQTYSLVLEHHHIDRQGGQHVEQLLPSHPVKTLDPTSKQVRSSHAPQ